MIRNWTNDCTKSKAIISLGFVFTIYSIKVLNSKWTVFQFDDKKFNEPNGMKLNSIFY